VKTDVIKDWQVCFDIPVSVDAFMKPYEINTPHSINYNIRDKFSSLMPENKVYTAMYLISKEYLEIILKIKAGFYDRKQDKVQLETYATLGGDIYV
jgi:hypothetical protein